MNIEEFRDYCLSLPCVEESMPFDNETLTYKIGGKVFALASMEDFNHFAVKCQPELAIELREQYSEVTPAFHLNKKHWNDISVEGSLTNKFQQEQIFASYMLVVNKNVSPKALRLELLDVIKSRYEL